MTGSSLFRTSQDTRKQQTED